MSAMTGTKDNLLVVHNNISGLTLLIDTGAEVSVFPPTSRDVNLNKTQQLTGPDGKQIATFGTRIVTFRLGDNQYNWNFIFAAVKRPLIGADFLRKKGILVDLKIKKLLDYSTHTVSSPRTSMMNVKTDSDGKEVYQNLLTEYKEKRREDKVRI